MALPQSYSLSVDAPDATDVPPMGLHPLVPIVIDSRCAAQADLVPLSAVHRRCSIPKRPLWAVCYHGGRVETSHGPPRSPLRTRVHQTHRSRHSEARPNPLESGYWLSFLVFRGDLRLQDDALRHGLQESRTHRWYGRTDPFGHGRLLYF